MKADDLAIETIAQLMLGIDVRTVQSNLLNRLCYYPVEATSTQWMTCNAFGCRWAWFPDEDAAQAECDRINKVNDGLVDMRASNKQEDDR